MAAAVHLKTCRSPGNMRKEMAVLASLTASNVRDVVPIIAIDRQVGPSTLATFHIEGYMLTADSLNCDVMHHLGALVKKVHRIGECRLFGALDEKLNISQPTKSFSEFVQRQTGKWAVWHRTAFDDAYVSSYGIWIRQEFSLLRTYFDGCRPLFCHGDLDFKNILVQSAVVAGLVDWEHSGVYCFEWEMRKLSRLYHQQPEFLDAFFEGYFGKIPDDYEALKKAICFLEAADLLGHLRWSIMHGLKDERKTTIFRMHQFFRPKEENK